MIIELSEKQYNEILKALEFYIRFHTGQSSMVLENCDKAREVEEIINKELNIEPWDWRTKWLAYEISRQMEYEKNKASYKKNNHKPLTCTWEPLPRIEIEFCPLTWEYY